MKEQELGLISYYKSIWIGLIGRQNLLYIHTDVVHTVLSIYLDSMLSISFNQFCCLKSWSVKSLGAYQHIVYLYSVYIDETMNSSVTVAAVKPIHSTPVSIPRLSAYISSVYLDSMLSISLNVKISAFRCIYKYDGLQL